METDRSLLFGVLALQAGLIDADQFAEACTVCSKLRMPFPLVDILKERGWIAPADVGHIEYLVERKLQKHGGDLVATLADVPDDMKRRLASIDDAELHRTLVTLGQQLTESEIDLPETVEILPERRGRYKITRLHETGGIGRIWKAWDPELRRDVALKELRPERANSVAHCSRFLTEAWITGHLQHPGIVPIYELDRGPDGQEPFYTMRFVNGQTLTEAVRTFHRKRAAGEADSLGLVALLNAFVAVCNTTAYAHSRGVIHRDLKGQNILLGDFGEVLVVDWGLAKLVNHDRERSETEPIMGDGDSLRQADLTIQGQTVGTLAYMAPEQAAGHQHLIDRRTDIYGLGALLYEILAGRAPFSGADTHEVLQKVLSKQPIPCRHFWPEVPSALESICARAMAKAPKDRYDQATDLAKEVQGWQEAQRREAEEDLERFFVLALDMLCIAGFDGYFKRLNPAFDRILGYTKEELLREPYVNFIHPDDRMITITEAEGLVTGLDIVSFENRYRCKDGSYRWFLWTAAPFPKRKLIYASARDITDRKDAEGRLLESEERYRSVIAAMRDGIVLLDSHGAICACNTSAERILGLTQDQMMGRTSLDPRWRAIHEDGSPFPGENFPAATTLRTGEPCSNIVMGVHKPGGELTWICINSQPLLHPDERTARGVVVSFSDITEQRIKEEELKGMAAALEVAKRQLHELSE